jgi:hypothetical protein
MNAPRRNQARGRRSHNKNRKPDMWRPVPPPAPPDPIKPATDPAALIESLGPPPLRGHSAPAEHYLRAVVERAALVATALAASADLLEETKGD